MPSLAAGGEPVKRRGFQEGRSKGRSLLKERGGVAKKSGHKWPGAFLINIRGGIPWEQ